MSCESETSNYGNSATKCGAACKAVSREQKEITLTDHRNNGDGGAAFIRFQERLSNMQYDYCQSLRKLSVSEWHKWVMSWCPSPQITPY